MGLMYMGVIPILHWCTMLKHPIHASAPLTLYGQASHKLIYGILAKIPQIMRNVWDASPYKVRGLIDNGGANLQFTPGNPHPIPPPDSKSKKLSTPNRYQILHNTIITKRILPNTSVSVFSAKMLHTAPPTHIYLSFNQDSL